MKERWWSWWNLRRLIIVPIFGLCIGVLAYLDPDMSTESKQMVATVQKDPVEDKLVDWVYAKSTKISKSQAREIVRTISNETNPLLLLALIQAESEFFPGALSSVGAIGLGQIMWKHWEKSLVEAGICKEKRDLFDYRSNIKATSFILKEVLKRSNGDVAGALDKYLGGGNKAYRDKIVWNFMSLSILSGKVTI